MTSLLMTGFPGFLGSALLPLILARPERADWRAVCLVQQRHMGTAEERLAELTEAHPHVADRVELITGDITEADLGIAADVRSDLDDIAEIWHLAAVYDLAVPEEIARKVNVEGTAHVLAFCASLPDFSRLQYVSTCYVSGSYSGEYPEDELDTGQTFRNHYESTKFEAERLVRHAMTGGLSATIYRPGIVVGDSQTGATQKYDGPYFLASFLRRQPPLAVVPAVGNPDEVKVCLVPRDFVVAAMDQLSVMPESVGKTYALTDPNPPTSRELVDTFAEHLGKKVVWVPLPLGPTRTLVDKVPGVEWLIGIPAEGLDYFASDTTYATDNTTNDLAGTGVSCPAFADYAPRLLDYMIAHPEFDSSAMV